MIAPEGSSDLDLGSAHDGGSVASADWNCRVCQRNNISSNKKCGACGSLREHVPAGAPSVAAPKIVYSKCLCITSCLYPCLTLSLNESMMNEDYSGNNLAFSVFKNCLGCPFCGPCVGAGVQNEVMGRKYDAHLPYDVIESLSSKNRVYTGESTREGSGKDDYNYTPPPAYGSLSFCTSLVYASCCYADTLASNYAVLEYKRSLGAIGYRWEESLHYTRCSVSNGTSSNDNKNSDLYSTKQTVLKVALLGDEGVGKTSLFYRLLNDGFVSLNKSTSSSNARKAKNAKKIRDKTVNLGTRMVHSSSMSTPLFLEFWDCPSNFSSNMFSSLSSNTSSNGSFVQDMVMDGVDVVLMVYDARKKDTFTKATAALNDLIIACTSANKPLPSTIMLSNFYDQIHDKNPCKFMPEVESFHRKHGAIKNCLVSARSSVGLLEVVQTLVHRVVEKSALGDNIEEPKSERAMERS